MQIKKNEKSQKIPKRIDTEVVKKLIIILHEDGMEKKTKIALKSRLSYDKCLLYLSWLELMGLIRKENDANNFEIIRLTRRGAELYSKYK